MFKMSLKYLREDDVPWTNALLYVSYISITLGEKATHNLSDNSLCPEKLELIKQEMARVNIDSLDISELKWTGMGKFNSDGYCIYYCGQESLRRNGVPLIVNKSLKCSIWVQSQKLQNDLSSLPRKTIQYHSN